MSHEYWYFCSGTRVEYFVHLLLTEPPHIRVSSLHHRPICIPPPPLPFNWGFSRPLSRCCFCCDLSWIHRRLFLSPSHPSCPNTESDWICKVCSFACCFPSQHVFICGIIFVFFFFLSCQFIQTESCQIFKKATPAHRRQTNTYTPCPTLFHPSTPAPADGLSPRWWGCTEVTPRLSLWQLAFQSHPLTTELTAQEINTKRWIGSGGGLRNAEISKAK